MSKKMSKILLVSTSVVAASALIALGCKKAVKRRKVTYFTVNKNDDSEESITDDTKIKDSDETNT